MYRAASRSACEISDSLLVWRCWQVYARRFHSHDELLRGVELGIKETTVKTYRNRAFQSLGIHFRSQLFTLIVSA